MHGKNLMHGKAHKKCTAKRTARERLDETHGKERPHGNDRNQRTTNNRNDARHCRALPFAVREAGMHGNDAFSLCSALCRAPHGIFVSILFYLILIFIFSISFTFC
jgi:hypothetical protein